jgi:hypothetical protein
MKIIDADGHILDKEKDIRAHLPEAQSGWLSGAFSRSGRKVGRTLQ